VLFVAIEAFAFTLSAVSHFGILNGDSPIRGDAFSLGQRLDVPRQRRFDELRRLMDDPRRQSRRQGLLDQQ
jgi:hypothetical protein